MQRHKFAKSQVFWAALVVNLHTRQMPTVAEFRARPQGSMDPDTQEQNSCAESQASFIVIERAL
jgi:hypothetical protein